jgi:hypothetical protein
MLNSNKSSITMYNNNAQAVITGGELSFPSVCDNTGCSISINSGSATIKNTGLYTFNFDGFGVGTTAGVVIVQLFKDGIAMPCAMDAVTVAVGSTENLHFSTTVIVPTCCYNTHTFTVRLVGVGFTFNHAKLSIVREA